MFYIAAEKIVIKYCTSFNCVVVF